MANITEINKKFYNKAYSTRSSFLALLHSFVSYDQQSKSKRNYKVIKALLQEIKKIKSKVTFLDYGFGHGSLILKIPSTVETNGCDIAEEAVYKFNRVAKFLKRDINVFTVDDLNSSSKEKKFDIIACSHVIEHVENDILLLTQLKILMNTGGVLVLNLPINEIWDDPKHARKYTKESAVKMVSDMGLIVRKVEESDKLTGFFLYYEQVHSLKKIFKLFLRVFRMLFAILPQFFSELVEKLLPAKFLNQQLIIVAAKDE